MELQKTQPKPEDQIKGLTDQVAKILDPEGDLIAKAFEQYGGLIITDHRDKDQIKAVQNAASDVRKKRIAVNAQVKLIKSAITKFSKKLGTDGKAMADQFNKLYLELKSKADEAILKTTNEEEVKEQEKLERVLSKVNRLLDAGFLGNGVQYIAGTVIVDANALDTMDEATLLEYIEKGQAENKRIADILNEANRSAVGKEPAEIQEVDPIEVVTNEAAPEVKENDLPFGALDPVPAEGAEIVEKVSDPKEVVIVPEPAIDKSFRAGWDGCRFAVVELLQNTKPMKRSDLINLISELSPE